MIINNNFGDSDSSSVSLNIMDSDPSSVSLNISDDLISGSIGDDIVNVNISGDLISGSTGDDILVSLDGNDTLDGKEGNDILAGKGGNDSLIGGLGDDTLTGGGVGFKEEAIFVTGDTSGIDTLTGGEGKDLFIFGGKSDPEPGNDSASIIHYDEAGDEDYAIVTDFDPSEDTIMLGASRNDYSLDNSPSSNGLYFGDELVAIIEGNAELSLNGSYFQFQNPTV